MDRASGVEKTFVAELGNPLANHVHGLPVHDIGGNVGHTAEPLELHPLQNQRTVWFAGDEDAGILQIEVPLPRSHVESQCLRERD